MNWQDDIDDELATDFAVISNHDQFHHSDHHSNARLAHQHQDYHQHQHQHHHHHQHHQNQQHQQHQHQHQHHQNQHQHHHHHHQQNDFSFSNQESNSGADSKQKFHYTLMAPTSMATKVTEETMTYLNQGQAYEIKLENVTDSSEAKRGFMCCIINMGFHERHMQPIENELWQQWSHQHPNEKIFSVDMMLSYNVFGVESDGLNKYEFLWDSSKTAGVFIRINSISTEFTPKKHGGEKGVPFKLAIETFSYNSKTHDSYFISAACCQIKVFKPKGAERKIRSDRDKVHKRPPLEQEKYHQSCDSTKFKECSIISLHPVNDSMDIYRHSHGHFGSKQILTASTSLSSTPVSTICSAPPLTSTTTTTTTTTPINSSSISNNNNNGNNISNNNNHNNSNENTDSNNNDNINNSSGSTDNNSNNREEETNTRNNSASAPTSVTSIRENSTTEPDMTHNHRHQHTQSHHHQQITSHIHKGKTCQSSNDYNSIYHSLLMPHDKETNAHSMGKNYDDIEQTSEGDLPSNYDSNLWPHSVSSMTNNMNNTNEHHYTSPNPNNTIANCQTNTANNNEHNNFSDNQSFNNDFYSKMNKNQTFGPVDNHHSQVNKYSGHDYDQNHHQGSYFEHSSHVTVSRNQSDSIGSNAYTSSENEDNETYYNPRDKPYSKPSTSKYHQSRSMVEDKSSHHQIERHHNSDGPKFVLASSSCHELISWLNTNRFGFLARTFNNYCGSDILRLFRSDLIQICGLIDGIRLYNCLHNRPIRPRRILYANYETSDVFHPIYLHQLTLDELIKELSETFKDFLTNQDSSKCSVGTMSTTSSLDSYSMSGNNCYESKSTNGRYSSPNSSSNVEKRSLTQGKSVHHDSPAIETPDDVLSRLEDFQNDDRDCIKKIHRLLIGGMCSVKVIANEQVIQFLEDESVWSVRFINSSRESVDACMTRKNPDQATNSLFHRQNRTM